MGLAEKRIIKAYQETTYQEFLTEINSSIESNIEFEVDWNSLPNEKYPDNLENGITEVYFKPILNSFKAIAIDDMGKEALKDSVKKIVIKDENDNAYANQAYNFDNGELTINHASYINIDKVDERTQVLTRLLENSL